MACLSSKHLCADALWFKVLRTPISPELVWTSYNFAVSLCCILWNVTSLNLSIISSFKRSWELLTWVITCLIRLVSMCCVYEVWDGWYLSIKRPWRSGFWSHTWSPVVDIATTSKVMSGYNFSIRPTTCSVWTMASWNEQHWTAKPRNTNWEGRLSTLGLL